MVGKQRLKMVHTSSILEPTEALISMHTLSYLYKQSVIFSGILSLSRSLSTHVSHRPPQSGNAHSSSRTHAYS